MAPASAAGSEGTVDERSLAERWVGEPFRDLELEDIDGGRVHLAALRGSPVVLNFWFLACAPCVAEIPKLNAVVDAYAGAGVAFLALTFDEPPELSEFLAEHPFRYRVVATSRELLDEIGVEEYPSHVIIDRAGRVVEVITGYDSGVQIRAALERTIAADR